MERLPGNAPATAQWAPKIAFLVTCCTHRTSTYHRTPRWDPLYYQMGPIPVPPTIYTAGANHSWIKQRSQMKIILQGDEQLDGDGGFVDIGQLCLLRFPNPLAPGIDNQIHGSWGTRLALLGRIVLNDHPCLFSCKSKII